MRWLELLMHYNYEIHYCLGDKNSAADALSQCAELQPPNGEDEQPQSLIPAEKFTELAACEADLTESDWEGLLEIVIAALAVPDAEILAETRRLSTDWQDKPEGLNSEDGIRRKDGRIWVPESDDLWRKVLGIYQ